MPGRNCKCLLDGVGCLCPIVNYGLASPTSSRIVFENANYATFVGTRRMGDRKEDIEVQGQVVFGESENNMWWRHSIPRWLLTSIYSHKYFQIKKIKSRADGSTGTT
jgi:hypothetical protein